jgi:hypothetical protein
MRTLIIAIAALVLCSGPALAHPSGQVVASGGGTSSGGGLVLRGTVGQAAVGVSGGASNILCHGYWCFGGSRVIAVEPPDGSGLPSAIAFGLPSPNPSRGEASFALALPAEAEVRLSVFDVAGRAVGDPLALRLGAGYHQLHWKALDGRAGIYFGVLEVNGAVEGRRRIVLVQ